MTRKKITTAVFPVAGMGTRFLPVTKSSPKEMLPIVDRPLIQYVVEEAIAAGITQLILVTSYSKRAVEDYFDSNFELEKRLEEKGNTELLEVVRNIIPKGVNVVYVRQRDPLGLGHAVLCAKEIVNNQPFAVLLADDIIHPNDCLKDMMRCYEDTGGSVIAVEEVASSEVSRYGIVSLAKQPQSAGQLDGIIEKPDVNSAPSRLAVVGRYLLTPRIFALLEATGCGLGGEIQLTDAIAKLIQEECVSAFPLRGRRYDCGSKLGFLEATIEYALAHPHLGEPFRAFLKERIAK